MIETGTNVKKAIRIAILGIAVLSLSACVARYRNHGYVPSEAELAEIIVGVDTRDSVIETVGPPSSGGVLNDSGFYYIATKMRHYGARKPKPVERHLVAVTFDTAGVVRNIERFGLEDGQVISLERRVTSSGVIDKTFLRQLLGNIGRFDPSTLFN